MAKEIKLSGDSGMQENCDQMISNCDLVNQPKISQAEFDIAMQNSLKQGSCKPVMNEIGLAISMCLLATERHKVMDAKLILNQELTHTSHDPEH